MDRREELYIKELKPGVYLLDERHEVAGYLIVGRKKALMIDTMNGYTDLHRAVREITDKPVMVVNTHGHSDHIAGNIYFEEVYINFKDLFLTKEVTESEQVLRFCKEKGLFMPEFREIKGGDVIELGDKTLEVYELPGHTPGSIVLLLKEDRILFSGDAINHHLWLQLDESMPVSDYVEQLDKVMFLQEEADYILHGHTNDFDDISLLRCMRQGCMEICAGKTQKDVPCKESFEVGMQHEFALEPGKHYQREDSVICYSPQRINHK